MTYHGQWGIPTDQVLQVNYFQDRRDGFFIDCGSSDGISENNTLFFEREMGWKGICLEPSGAYSYLVDNRPACMCLKAAMSNTEGRIEFEEATKPGLFSAGAVIYNPAHKADVANIGYSFNKITVDCITYKTLVENMCPDKIDLFSVDVEGYELQVIEGMAGAKVFPDVICIEYTVTGLTNIKNALAALGYRYDFLSYNNAFFSIGYPVKEWFGETVWWQGYLPEGVT